MKLPSRYVAVEGDFDSGGMSSTLLCDDKHLDRKVVVKTLKEGVDQRRILDELGALQNIRSKHVVQIYDVVTDSDDNVVAIVEEYIPGNDLTKVAVPTTEVEFCNLAYPIARGIAHIHAHGRIHRDIKRQNMKFDAEGCLKIFDFGLSREDGADEASTIGTWGTAGYMAPELYKADGDGRVEFTSAVDTYAFGATVLALLRGSLPASMRKNPPSFPCAEADFTVYSAVPRPLLAMMNATFAIDPADRPSMAEIADRIGTYLLKDRHRALLVSDTSTFTLDKKQPKVQLSVAGRGGVDISYNGLEFVVSALSGDVAINNMSVSVGDKLPGSCVIALGNISLGHNRAFITVDVSHPEVAL